MCMCLGLRRLLVLALADVHCVQSKTCWQKTCHLS